MKISIQLYSLRNQIEEKGILPILKECKSFGFDCVETAGFYGLKSEEFYSLVNDCGLKISGSHISYEQVLSDTDSVINIAKALDMKHIIIPGIGIEALKSEFPSLTSKLNTAAKSIHEAGLELAYHNHSHEFDGKSDYLVLLEKSVDGLKLELDTFWLKAAGMSPLEYAKTHQKNLLTFHLKELAQKGKDAPEPLFGEGVSDLKQIISFSKKINLPYVVVEVEQSDIDYREYLKHSVKYILAND